MARYSYTILFILGIFSLSQGTMAQSPTQAKNYVLSKTYREANTTTQPTSSASVRSEIAYYDGLGRPIQKISHKQAGNGNDLVTHMAYDGLGRQDLEYLPYARNTSSLSFDGNAEGGTLSFYSDPDYGDTAYPFSQKEFDETPLNRVMKQAAPGDEWSLGSGHEVKFKYETNYGSQIHSFSASYSGNTLPNLAYHQKYPAGELYKTTTYNENNETLSRPGSAVEYKDKLGRVVLKRVYTTTSGRTSDPDPTLALDTYYVYDDFGNLAVVIPPRLSEQIVSGSSLVSNHTTLLDNLGYRYTYDHRNRMIQKKLPGKQTEYIAYDPLDRPIATGPVLSPFGDGTTGWLRTKYDALGRVAYTMWVQGTVGESSRQAQENITGPDFSEERTSSPTTVNGVSFGYSSNVAPTGGYHVLTVNYYDDYDWPGAPSSIPTTVGDGDESVYYNNGSKRPKGLATGSWVRIVTDAATTDAKVTHMLYDEKGRAVRTRADYPLSGYLQVDTKFNFIGKPLYTIILHKKENGSPLKTVRETYGYDAQDRLVSHTHKVDGLPTQLLAKNTYDELGQLVQKNTGGTDLSGGNAFQDVDYRYNIRGWLTDINDAGNLLASGQPADIFGFHLNYTQVPEQDINGQVQPLYNGNIAETTWRTSSDNIKRRYGYTYDYTNRLLDAWYQKPNSALPINESYNEHLTYDANGNILTLLRNGSYEVTGTTPAIVIDDLEYTYHSNSNKLKKVYDGEVNPEGFDDGYTGNYDEYLYDDFGNLTRDRNKDITAIDYNHLNLPVKITFGSQGHIDYMYDANGVKMEKTVTESSSVVTEYRDGFQYTDGLLDFFPHSEGTVEVTYSGKTTTNVSYSYVFHYVDHLGNIRVRYAKNPQTNVLNILKESHYYPFGLEHEGYNEQQRTFKYNEEETFVLTPVTPMDLVSFNYGFNGKELNQELGLEWYDFGARNYDPALGRWMNVDPLAEKYFNESLYNYGLNNPVFFIDPDGRRVDVTNLVQGGEQEDSWLLLGLMIDLAEKSGQKISVSTDNNGNSTLIGSGCESDCENTSDSLSSYVDHLLSSDETIVVSRTNDGSSALSNNYVDLDAEEINGIMGALKNAGLDENTMDIGMVFLHETLHTRAGADYFNSEKDNSEKRPDNNTFYDPIKPKNRENPGGTVDRINQFRKELKLPTRYKYGNEYGTMHFELNGTKYDLKVSKKPINKE